MLQNSFVHIPGITKQTEQAIWSNDILNWDQFLESGNTIGLSHSKIQKITEHIHLSRIALDNKDYNFFCLPSKEQWRLYENLKDQCCFLDIETTGLSKHRNQITLIGLYNGQESKIYVNGQNLDEFKDEIVKYPLVVSFNGKCFDIPFIRAKYPDLEYDPFHIDLRFVMASLGYSGGLKNIEKMIGIQRDDDLGDIDGFEAVRLWHRYKRGDEEALNLLIKYNIADIENLKTLMNFAYDKLLKVEFKRHTTQDNA